MFHCLKHHSGDSLESVLFGSKSPKTGLGRAQLRTENWILELFIATSSILNWSLFVCVPDMSIAKKCCFFVSLRWSKRVASCLIIFGLAVAIVFLLFPGENEKKNHSVKNGENAAGTVEYPPQLLKEGFYERNNTVLKGNTRQAWRLQMKPSRCYVLAACKGHL